MAPYRSSNRDPLDILSEAWSVLRLSVRCPSRVPTWDAIVLTAASPAQANLFQWRLEQAQLKGTIAASTVVLAVPDPQGHRIGSGGATLCAIRGLACHLSLSRGGETQAFPATKQWPPQATGLANQEGSITGMRVLLLHTGGDSKRVPWANPIGKAFIPLPFLAGEDPDGPIMTLFDHILAISARALQAFANKGGLLIMTGDVLPCFDASTLSLPESGACVVTVPTALATASKHGVILSCASEKKPYLPFNGNTILKLQGQEGEEEPVRPVLVEDLLQKPSVEDMMKRGAVSSAGMALLDTGIFAVRGAAWNDLVGLALADPNPLTDIVAEREEVGELAFLHFGTSSEVLDHLAEDHGERVTRQHFSAVASATSCEVAPSAVLIGCDVSGGVSVGEGSFLFDCTLGQGVQIGSRCVAMGLHVQDQSGERKLSCRPASAPQRPLVVPNGRCLWAVPLTGSSHLDRSEAARVIVCCGIDDDPKLPAVKGGTFCGKSWSRFLSERGIRYEDLWDWAGKGNSQDDLWHARLFPVVPPGEGIDFSMWLMGIGLKDTAEHICGLWRANKRVSLADLHGCIDFKQMYCETREHHARLASGFAQASINCGFMGRNVAQLCQGIMLANKDSGVEICHDLLSQCPEPGGGCFLQLPASRAYQVQADIYKACGDEIASVDAEKKVWRSVAAETSAAAVQDDVVGKVNAVEREVLKLKNEGICHPILLSTSVRSVTVELPVRLDIVGGWSDTPPWSLERSGCVLNMAVHLEGCSPLGAEIVVKPSSSGVFVSDDAGHMARIDAVALSPPFQADDPFRLVKAALIVTGYGGQNSWDVSPMLGGLEIRTWSNVPRGSGLGVSSILAAAVVKGLLRAKGGDEAPETVVRLVFVLEQLMGTGGGWQDQIGGVYPGIKCTTSFPGRPLRWNVESIPVGSPLRALLEERMVVVFTGQVRLAHTVLQKVVRRYLQRDTRLISAIKRLASLAKFGQAAFASHDLDAVGNIMAEAWLLHQELDPDCSNLFVDSLFKSVAHLSCGHKLVGAGGGGFAILMAKNKEAAASMKVLLTGFGPPVKVFEWSLT